MELVSLIRGLAAVAVSCGVILTSLSLWHESGITISLWLGIVTAVVVAFGLAVVGAILYFAPNGIALFGAITNDLRASLLVWVATAILVLFIGNALSDPQRISDFGFFLPMGLLYGSVSGLAFWWFTGNRSF